MGRGEGSLPRPKKQSAGLFFAYSGTPAFSPPLHSKSKSKAPQRDTLWGFTFGAGEGSRTLVLSLEG